MAGSKLYPSRPNGNACLVYSHRLNFFLYANLFLYIFLEIDIPL